MDFFVQFSMAKFANKIHRENAIAEDWNAKQDEIASLKAQLQAVHPLRANLLTALNENEQLRAELAECKKDAERMDWLSKCTSETDDYAGVWASWEDGNLRDCIDAAMAQKEKA